MRIPDMLLSTRQCYVDKVDMILTSKNKRRKLSYNIYWLISIALLINIFIHEKIVSFFGIKPQWFISNKMLFWKLWEVLIINISFSAAKIENDYALKLPFYYFSLFLNCIENNFKAVQKENIQFICVNNHANELHVFLLTSENALLFVSVFVVVKFFVSYYFTVEKGTFEWLIDVHESLNYWKY